MKLILNHEEKAALADIIKVWERAQITQDSLRHIQQATGVPSRLIETIFYQVDTLDALSELDWLVFKGGTCVQSHLPYQKQRASVDLDLNSRIGNPNAIEHQIDSCNEQLRKLGRTTIIQNIEFGTLAYQGTDEHSGTLNYIRRVPSKFGEFEKAGGNLIQSKSLRVQINYKHSWLPCVRPIEKMFEPFILGYQTPKTTTQFVHSSPEDMFVDKILTTSNIGDFGRERYKDVYDLYQLSSIITDHDIILKKLDLISTRAGLSSKAILDASKETISKFSNHSMEAKGFGSMVCNGGKKDIEDWEHVCNTLIGSISDLTGKR